MNRSSIFRCDNIDQHQFGFDIFFQLVRTLRKTTFLRRQTFVYNTTHHIHTAARHSDTQSQSIFFFRKNKNRNRSLKNLLPLSRKKPPPFTTREPYLIAIPKPCPHQLPSPLSSPSCSVIQSHKPPVTQSHNLRHPVTQPPVPSPAERGTEPQPPVTASFTSFPSTHTPAIPHPDHNLNTVFHLHPNIQPNMLSRTTSSSSSRTTSTPPRSAIPDRIESCRNWREACDEFPLYVRYERARKYFLMSVSENYRYRYPHREMSCDTTTISGTLFHGY